MLSDAPATIRILPQPGDSHENLLMPLFEYVCRACSHQFEILIRPGAPTPSCAKCGGTDLEKLLSHVAMSSEATRALHLAGARKAASKVQKDKAVAQFEYEEKHRHEH